MSNKSPQADYRIVTTSGLS